MPREKLAFFVENLDRSKAQVLIQKVFGLQKELDMSYPQMAKESGLKKEQLYRLKCLWLNKKGKQKFLSAELANGLVKFWNKHLDGEDIMSSGSNPAEDITEKTIALMLKKSGLKRTALLLKRRGKSHLLEKHLETLSAPQLADLV